MRGRGAAACAALLLACGCAARQTWRPPILAVRVTFRSHLSLVRNCESRGVAPTLEEAKAAGANLGLVFEPPYRGASGNANPQGAGGEPAWIPVERNPAGFSGVRAFRCPEAFVEKVAAEMKRPREARE